MATQVVTSLDETDVAQIQSAAIKAPRTSAPVLLCVGAVKAVTITFFDPVNRHIHLYIQFLDTA